MSQKISDIVISYITNDEYNELGNYQLAKVIIQKEELQSYNNPDDLCKLVKKHRDRIKLLALEDQEVKGFDSNKEINSSYTKDINDTNGTAVLEGKRVTSLQDLIDKCEIDLNVYEIERHVINKWEVGAKDNTNTIQVTPLFQIKVWLRKKSASKLELNNLKEEILSDLKSITWNNTKRKEHNGNLFVPNIFDLHLGKLAWGEETGEDYDLGIAKERFEFAIDDLIQKANPYNIGKVMFIVGNDFFNSDKAFPFPQTTAGTPQLDDTRYQKLFREGRKLIVSAINRLSEIADVDVLMQSGNHDTERIVYLGEVLEAIYENNKRVSVDNSPKSRKYYQFGQVLLGSTHGNNEKMDKLPLLMAQEAKEMWASTFYREWLLGHLHHKNKLITQESKDYQGVIISQLTSPSSADAWHHTKGYVGAIKGAEGFIYNKEEGKIASVIHNIK